MTKSSSDRFDFAGPVFNLQSGPTGGAQTLSLGGQGQSAPAAGRSRGGDGQVTVAEKRASVKGQQERGTLGASGAKDRCKKGKSCGLTCIAGNEDCIVDFPEPVQAELTRMAQFILNKAKKSGQEVEAGSQRDIELGQSLGMAGKHLTAQSKSGTDRLFATTTPGQSRLLTALEIADLKANRDKLGDSEFNEKARQAWQKDVSSRGVTLNRKDLEMIYEALPQAAKNQLNNSGNPGKGKWYGVKEGEEVTTANNGSKERGLAVLDMYFKQAGTDAYGKSNRSMSPADFDVEHIRPVSKGGLDHPSNWVLARSGAQRQRADAELGKWIDSLPDPRDRAAMKAYYDAAAKKGKAKGALKAMLASLDPKSMGDAELLKISPSNMKYLFNRDSFFVSGLYGLGAGGRLTNTQPAVFGRAYGLARKYLSDDEAAAIRSEVKKVWNKEWMEGGGSTKKMVDDYINIYRSRLPAESFKLLEPEIEKWKNGILSEYPETSPRAQ